MKKFLLTFTLAIAMVLGCGFGCISAMAAKFDAGTEYKVSGYDNNDGSYIVSAFNVKDFGAKGDGVTDDTEAIEEAFSAVVFGPKSGVVYFPAGKYRVTKPGFKVMSGYTVIGQWNDPSKNSDGEETVIIADYAEDRGTPLFCLSGMSSLLNMSFYYPQQDIENVKEYAYTISTYWSNAVNNFVTVRNITLYNSYRGVCALGGAQHVSNVYGTVLSLGVDVGCSAEVSEFMNMDLSSAYWNAYDSTDKAKIQAYTSENARGMQVGYDDDLLIYNVNFPADEFAKGIHFYKASPEFSGLSSIAYGFTYKLHDSEISYSEDHEYPAGYPEMRHLDQVPGTDRYSFYEPANRYSSKTDLFNVRASAYGAKGNGAQDDTAAFEAALSAAGKNGGGIVFVPAGDYVITKSLTVPKNVEVLGEWYGYRTGSPSQINMKLKGSENDALFILKEGSGVQGLTFYLPENKAADYVPPTGDGYGYANGESYNVLQDVFPYEHMDLQGFPWLIRSAGKNCWAENLCITNAWNGMDFTSEKSDNFVVRGVWGTCMNSGLEVGGGSDNGRISCVFFTFGTWWESIARGYDLSLYSYANSIGFTFGDCSNIQVLSAATFGLSRGLRFLKEDGGIPENISILRSLIDTPYGIVCLDLQAGNNLSFVGVSTGTHPTPANGRVSTAITVGDKFDGKARLYGQNIWAGGENVMRGDVILYTQESTTAEVIEHNFTAPDYTLSSTNGSDKKGNGCKGSVAAEGLFALPALALAAVAILTKKGVKR